MTSKLLFLFALGFLIYSAIGCVREIPVEEPIPENRTTPQETATQPGPRIQASLKLTDQGRRLLEEKQPDRAIRILEQAISLNPSNGRNYYYISEAWLMKKFVAEARKFNNLAESHVKGDEAWMRRVAHQAERITKLEVKIKKFR